MIKLADMAADWRLSFFSPSLQLQLDYGDGVPYLLNRFTPCSDNIQMIGARHDMNCGRLFMSQINEVHFVATCHSEFGGGHQCTRTNKDPKEVKSLGFKHTIVVPSLKHMSFQKTPNSNFVFLHLAALAQNNPTRICRWDEDRTSAGPSAEMFV